MIKAIVFDLDDTLFPEYDYVCSGFRCVAEYIQTKYAIKDDIYSIMLDLFSKDKNKVYNRVLEYYGIAYNTQEIQELIEVYRTHKPSNLHFFDGVESTLKELRKQGYKLGVITDGREYTQQSKIDALGLKDLVDEIIITDSLGGEQYRKPNPLAFEIMADKLNVKYEEMAYVGDNPQKDFAISAIYPIYTIQVLSKGIYKDSDYLKGIKPNGIIKNIKDLFYDKSITSHR